jgi:hypothetical protein
MLLIARTALISQRHDSCLKDLFAAALWARIHPLNEPSCQFGSSNSLATRWFLVE